MLDSHTTLACHPRPSSRALVRATLVALLIAGAVTALPAVAQASDNDFFVNAVRINTPGTTLGSFSEAHDNIGATTEDGENGPFTQCATVFYGATVWYWFFPHVNGRVHVTVTTSGAFDPVASVIRWTGNGVTEAFLEDGLCNGPIPGLNRTDVPINGFVPVSAGQQYAVQVGGAKSPNTAGGTAGTGDYSVFFDYDPDSDGDGLFDSEDQCDSEAGPAIHAGCPDNDGDGIPNRSDSCVNLAGGPTYQGCPDADGDKVPEGGEDKCEGLNPERVNRADRKPRDGCPDNLRILSNTKQLVAPQRERHPHRRVLRRGRAQGGASPSQVQAAEWQQLRQDARQACRCRHRPQRRACKGHPAARHPQATQQDAAVWLNDHGPRDCPLRDRKVHSRQGRAREADLQAVPLHHARHQEAAQEGLRVSACPHSPRAGGGGRGSVRSLVRCGKGERRGRDDAGVRRVSRRAPRRSRCRTARRMCLRLPP